MSVNFATLNSSEKVPLIRIHLHLIGTENKKKKKTKEKLQKSHLQSQNSII